MTVLLGVIGNPNLKTESYEFLSALHESNLDVYDPRFNTWETFKTLLPQSYEEHFELFKKVFEEKGYSEINTILTSIQLKNSGYKESRGYNIVEAYVYALFSVRNTNYFEIDPFESVEKLASYFESLASGGEKFSQTSFRINRSIELQSDDF